MKPVIKFSECLADSPKFRSQLQQNEANLDEMESRLDKMIKLCSAMTDGGRMYVTQQVGSLNAMHTHIFFKCKSHKTCYDYPSPLPALLSLFYLV